MGVFSSYTGKIFFPNWRIFFSQLEKKKSGILQTCISCSPLTPTHVHTRA